MLPAHAFRVNPKMAGGLHSWCKPCCVEATQRWRADHPAEVADANAARRRPKMTKSCAECGCEFVAARKDALTCSRKCRLRRHRRNRDPEKERERQRKRARHRDHVRRTRRQAGDLTVADVSRLLAAQRKCPLCSCWMTVRRGPRQRQLDHIVPIAAGGTHTRANVRVICRTCNLARPWDGSDVEQESLWARSVVLSPG